MTQRSRWAAAAVGVASLAFAVLFYLPLPAAKPNEAGFVGRWQLEASSLPSVLARTGRKPADSHLILEADGRFTAVSFPVEDHFTKPNYRLESGEGRWELSQNQYHVWSLDLVFPGGKCRSLDIRNDNGGLVTLGHAVYEPESSERWTWRKAP